MIEAKIVEISPTEIKYRRFDNLDGPVITVPAANVFSIRYENGTLEVINAVQETQTSIPIFAVIDPGKLYFGIAVDPSGFLLNGPAITVDFSKGGLNARVNMRLPFLGMSSGTDGSFFGMAIGLNYVLHFTYGSLYLGAMGELAFGSYRIENYYIDALGVRVDEGRTESGLGYLGFAANIGYKLVFSTGISINANVYLGLDLPLLGSMSFLFRPALSVGYDFL